jgi:hypothetical protein
MQAPGVSPKRVGLLRSASKQVVVNFLEMVTASLPHTGKSAPLR